MRPATDTSRTGRPGVWVRPSALRGRQLNSGDCEMDLVLQALSSGGHEGEVEVVEHKGIGHPDTMCDALAEAFGVALARFYLERFGSLLHFNVDKALLAGGASKPAFRAGEVLAPIQVFLA